MKQRTKKLSGLTIGLDVGDRRSVAIVLDAEGEVIEELKNRIDQSRNSFCIWLPTAMSSRT